MTAATHEGLAGCLGSRVELPLPVRNSDSGRFLRTTIREVFTAWDAPSEMIDRAERVASEYWGNVVTHTDSVTALFTACRFQNDIHIEIRDFGSPTRPGTYPTVLDADDDEEAHRGLKLVGLLAPSASWTDTGSGLLRSADFALPLTVPTVPDTVGKSDLALS